MILVMETHPFGDTSAPEACESAFSDEGRSFETLPEPSTDKHSTFVLMYRATPDPLGQ